MIKQFFLAGASLKHLICPIIDLKEQFFNLNNFNICISILKTDKNCVIINLNHLLLIKI